MNIEQWGKDFTERPERTIVRAIAWIVAIAVGLSLIGWVVSTAVFPADQAGNIMRRTLDADNAIENYEWFIAKYNGIQATSTQLDIAKAEADIFGQSMAGVPHEQWSREDRASAASHSAAVNGIGMQRASMIAEYNARSAMSNRNLFKAKHLPYRLGPDGKEALDAADVKVTK